MFSGLKVPGISVALSLDVMCNGTGIQETHIQMEVTMNTLNQAKRWSGIFGAILTMVLVAVGGGQALAQEMYKLSPDLYRASGTTHQVSMDSKLAVPAPGLRTPMLDRPALPASGEAKEAVREPKETRESVLEQIAALGGMFGKSLKAASSRCTGWQSGGFEQPGMGPDAGVNRACVFQFDLPN